jgi:SAM-dependent methyltransferase
MTRRSFEDLLAEAASAPIDGWDFAWLDGRAIEYRPSWHYFELVAARATHSRAMVDLETGAGTMIRDLPAVPPLLVATEGYQLNLATASSRLSGRGGHLVRTDSSQPALPFRSESFDLVVSCHPIRTWWAEVARVLEPGGIFL